MKRALVKKALILLTVFTMVLLSCVNSYATKDFMAYNIYSNPDLSKTSDTFTTFMIDFRGVQTPDRTYWALCNFGLYFSEEAKAEYPGIRGGGAYAGLQNVTDNSDTSNEGRTAIMAFWEMFYKPKGAFEEQNLRAQRMYPAGKDNHFGGEGEGTNHITEYLWDDNTWYRMVLHSWDDIETGRTFVGQWFQNLETGEWTLISYFNSKLTNSCLRGNLSLFQENFVGGINQFVEREFNVKNIYALDNADNEWKSLNTSTLSYGNGGAANKEGGHSFGATDEYFWGIGGGDTDGLTQEEYEAKSTKSQKFTINQPDKPTFCESLAPTSVQVKKMAGTWSLVMTQNKLSAPQLEVKVEVIDEDDNIIHTVDRTRPDLIYIKMPEVKTDAFKCRVTITDIFGGSVVVEAPSKDYKGDTAPVETTPAPVTTPAPEASGIDPVIIIAAVAGVIVIGGAVVLIVAINAKKKKS